MRYMYIIERYTFWTEYISLHLICLKKQVLSKQTTRARHCTDDQKYKISCLQGYTDDVKLRLKKQKPEQRTVWNGCGLNILPMPWSCGIYFSYTHQKAVFCGLAITCFVNKNYMFGLCLTLTLSLHIADVALAAYKHCLGVTLRHAHKYTKNDQHMGINQPIKSRFSFIQVRKRVIIDNYGLQVWFTNSQF